MNRSAKQPAITFPVGTQENVVVLWNRTYWAARGRRWREVTPVSEETYAALEHRMMTLFYTGGGAIFAAAIFMTAAVIKTTPADGPWLLQAIDSPWTWLIVAIIGALSIIGGLVLSLRLRTMAHFAANNPQNLFSYASYLAGTPRLLDLDHDHSAQEPRGGQD